MIGSHDGRLRHACEVENVSIRFSRLGGKREVLLEKNCARSCDVDGRGLQTRHEITCGDLASESELRH